MTPAPYLPGAPMRSGEKGNVAGYVMARLKTIPWAATIRRIIVSG